MFDINIKYERREGNMFMFTFCRMKIGEILFNSKTLTMKNKITKL